LPAFYNYDILYVEVIKNDKKEREDVELGMPLAVNGEKPSEVYIKSCHIKALHGSN